MNMLDLQNEVLRHDFIDPHEPDTNYMYVGKWLADNKYEYETLVGFLRLHKIKFSFCSLYQFCHRFGLKVYPLTVKEANKLFFSPWRSKLFIVRKSTN